VFAVLRIVGLWMVVVPAIFGHSHKEDLAKDRAKFEQETDPVHKAKLMVHLGRAEFEEIEKQAANNNLDEALKGAREYETQADSVAKALDARGVNPEKHASGFKELQISVREALRRLSYLMVGFSGDEQKPFLAIRDNLDTLNRHLINELFPRQPDARLDSGKKKG
jgi:hypothetical protein